MKGDFVRREPQRLADDHLVHSLKLRWDPSLGSITFESNRSVQWLHGRVSQVWKLILGDNSIGRRNFFKRLLVTARDRNITGRAKEFFEFRPQLQAVRALNAGQIPIDLQTIACLLRRPESIG